MQQPTEYHQLLEQSGLKQYQLADLLGTDRTTVNRWDGAGKHAKAAPTYAIQFLRAYIMLSPEGRLSLHR